MKLLGKRTIHGRHGEPLELHRGFYREAGLTECFVRPIEYSGIGELRSMLVARRAVGRRFAAKVEDALGKAGLNFEMEQRAKTIRRAVNKANRFDMPELGDGILGRLGRVTDWYGARVIIKPDRIHKVKLHEIETDMGVAYMGVSEGDAQEFIAPEGKPNFMRLMEKIWSGKGMGPVRTIVNPHEGTYWVEGCVLSVGGSILTPISPGFSGIDPGIEVEYTNESGELFQIIRITGVEKFYLALELVYSLLDREQLTFLFDSIAYPKGREVDGNYTEYRAIHVAGIVDGVPVEVQIRSELMDKEAKTIIKRPGLD